MDLPESRASRTASSRNSRGYGDRLPGIVDSLPGACPPNDQVSTEPGQLQIALLRATRLLVRVAGDPADLVGRAEEVIAGRVPGRLALRVRAAVAVRVRLLDDARIQGLRIPNRSEER